MGDKMEETDTKTILESDVAKDADENPKKYRVIGIFIIVPLVIGFGIACIIYFAGPKSTYNDRISTYVKPGELEWAFGALVILGRTIAFLNAYPMVHKGRIMIQGQGNFRANPFIFKVVGADLRVIYDEAGATGEYNRSNRSVQHMLENFGVILAGLFLVSKVFPKAVFSLTLIWGVGRIAHQVGYSVAYGKHAIGFATALFCRSIIEGLALVVVFRAGGVF